MPEYFKDLEIKAKDPNNTMLILCSPHNPVGRVWAKEEITKIVDTFTPTHDGANFTNAFGYVINDNLGTINTSQSNFYSLEEANQIILFPNAREAVTNKQKFTVTREFPEGIDKIQYKRNYR